jgi:hypothetical protein
VPDPRTELVGRGYDVIGERFAEWRDKIVGDPAGSGRRSSCRVSRTGRACSS